MTITKKWLRAMKSKKYREKLSKINKKKWENPKYRKRLSRIMKKSYKNLKLRKKIDKAVTKWWKEHPNIKKQKSQELKDFFLKHPDDFKSKFMNGKNNPFKPHIQTKLNVKVRSKGEQQIADFLNQNKIKAQYESKTLLLDGYICVPDFYLPKQKACKETHIEFYGGHPGSYKKKLIKNKLYKKHHIPCIFITPAELSNLNRFLLRELRD